MEKKEKELRWDWEIIKNYPLLYVGRDKPLTESLIPFGFECRKGWAQPLEELSVRLEALNVLYYQKFGTRIQAAQVKEKFGTLRFYYDIVVDGNAIVRPVRKLLEWLRLRLRKVDYGYIEVVDKEAYTSIEEDVYDTKEEWEEMKKLYAGCKDSKCFEKDGKWYIQYPVMHCKRSHQVPTKNLFAYFLYDKFITSCNRALDFIDVAPTGQDVIAEYLFYEAEKAVREAEDKCYHFCEDCGWQIGTDESPRCQTAGWVTFICQDCAKKEGHRYYLNGDLMEGDKVVMTKEELKADREARRKKRDEEAAKQEAEEWEKEKANG